jgi:hypothetical protein
MHALEGQYPGRVLYQALAIAATCVREQPNMVDIVTALKYPPSQTCDPNIHPVQSSLNSSSFHSPSTDDKRHSIPQCTSYLFFSSICLMNYGRLSK